MNRSRLILFLRGKRKTKHSIVYESERGKEKRRRQKEKKRYLRRNLFQKIWFFIESNE